MLVRVQSWAPSKNIRHRNKRPRFRGFFASSGIARSQAALPRPQLKPRGSLQRFPREAPSKSPAPKADPSKIPKNVPQRLIACQVAACIQKPAGVGHEKRRPRWTKLPLRPHVRKKSTAQGGKAAQATRSRTASHGAISETRVCKQTLISIWRPCHQGVTSIASLHNPSHGRDMHTAHKATITAEPIESLLAHARRLIRVLIVL